MLFVVPEKKIVKLKSILTELINDFPNLKVRRVASVSGFVISLSVALRPVARLFTRQMHFFINLRQSWNDVLVANEGVLQELKFWLAHVDAFNGWIFPAHFEYFCTVFLRILCLFFWFNCFLFLDVLQVGVWKHRQDLKSNKLKELADSLPAFVLSSRSVSTNVKYKNAWLNWTKWEKDNLGVNVFPVSPFFLSLYLIDKFQSCNLPSPIEAAVYGVKWAHDIAGVPSPIESTLVRQVLEAAKRLLGKPAQGKQAVSFDVITKVVEKFNTPLASLSDLRTCFIFVLAFAVIMRSHEIINIKRSQLI